MHAQLLSFCALFYEPRSTEEEEKNRDGDNKAVSHHDPAPVVTRLGLLRPAAILSYTLCSGQVLVGTSALGTKTPARRCLRIYAFIRYIWCSLLFSDITDHDGWDVHMRWPCSVRRRGGQGKLDLGFHAMVILFFEYCRLVGLQYTTKASFLDLNCGLITLDRILKLLATMPPSIFTLKTSPSTVVCAIGYLGSFS